MSDKILFDLVLEWSNSLSPEMAYIATCKIANHLNLSQPKDDTDSLVVIFHVSKNYPDIYREATKVLRKSGKIAKKRRK